MFRFPRRNRRRVPLSMVLRGQHRRDGFAIIEAAVSVLVLAFLAILLAQLHRKSEISLVQSRDMRSAATLADMVFERYVEWASNDFTGLPTHDITRATPGTFFDTPGKDNMGYDGLLITSKTQPVAGHPTQR